MGLFRTAGRAAVITSTVGRVQRRQQQRFAAEDAVAQNGQTTSPSDTSPASPAPAVAVAPASNATDHKLTQLKQLGELRVAGVLTEKEFAAEKAKILAL